MCMCVVCYLCSYLEFKPEREMVSMKEINEVNTGTGGREGHVHVEFYSLLNLYLSLLHPYMCCCFIVVVFVMLFTYVCMTCACAEDKVMTLRVKHKDNELLFTPSRETRKEGTEWLKALKKVQFLQYSATVYKYSFWGDTGLAND